MNCDEVLLLVDWSMLMSTDATLTESFDRFSPPLMAASFLLFSLVSSLIRLCTISSIVATMRVSSTEGFSWHSCFARQSAE